MNLRDLFRPKWQHSNARVRAEIVAHLGDISILSTVATEDTDAKVRETALQRLEALAKYTVDIAVQWASSDKKDQHNWVQILKKSPLGTKMLKSLDRIVGQEVLSDTQHTELFLTVFNRFIQESTRSAVGQLDWIARNAKNEETKRHAACIVLPLINRIKEKSAIEGDYIIHPDIIALARQNNKNMTTHAEVNMTVEQTTDISSKPPLIEDSKFHDFGQKAVIGPADCRINITQFTNLYQALVQALQKCGISNRDIVDLVSTRLLGVCPECYTWSGGQGLAMIASFGQNRGMILGGATGGAERLTQGLCRNTNCSCRDILIFWKPDEDQVVITRLAKMGIEISPRL